MISVIVNLCRDIHFSCHSLFWSNTQLVGECCIAEKDSNSDVWTYNQLIYPFIYPKCTERERGEERERDRERERERGRERREREKDDDERDEMRRRREERGEREGLSLHTNDCTVLLCNLASFLLCSSKVENGPGYINSDHLHYHISSNPLPTPYARTRLLLACHPHNADDHASI